MKYLNTENKTWGRWKNVASKVAQAGQESKGLRKKGSHRKQGGVQEGKKAGRLQVTVRDADQGHLL